MVMCSVTVLPRTLIHRTRWGTSIFWDRKAGPPGAGPHGALAVNDARAAAPAVSGRLDRLAMFLPTDSGAGKQW